MKKYRFITSKIGAAFVAGVLALAPVAVVPAMADEEEYTLENEEDAGWFGRAVEGAGPAYGEADEYQRDEGYFLENEEDTGWFDRAVEAAGPDYTDADEFE